MNEQQTPLTPPVPVSNNPLGKIRPIFKALWSKLTQTRFYQNKKIFYPVSISLGLVLFIIFIGLIFGGKKSPSVPKSTPSPTPPFVQSTDSPDVGLDTLSQIERSLTDIKNQIINLDVKQSRLQPPALDFKIKF
jgi:hypothetical protein